MSKINEILSGWANVIYGNLGLLDDETRLMAQQRLEICNPCPVRLNNSCSPQIEIQNVVSGEMVKGCGCNIAAKTLSPQSSCPASKW